MTKTYDAAKLTTSTMYQVRLAIGDRVVASMLLEDEEITYVISSSANLRAAAIECCNLMAAAIWERVAYSKGKISEQQDQQLRNIENTRQRLMTGDGALFQGKSHLNAEFFAGGVNVADSEGLDQDTGLRQPSFKRDTDRHPGSAWPAGDTDGWEP